MQTVYGKMIEFLGRVKFDHVLAFAVKDNDEDILLAKVGELNGLSEEAPLSFIV